MNNIYSCVLDCEGEKYAYTIFAGNIRGAVKKFIDTYESGVDKGERTSFAETMDGLDMKCDDFWQFTYNGDMQLTVHLIDTKNLTLNHIMPQSKSNGKEIVELVPKHINMPACNYTGKPTRTFVHNPDN